MEFVLVKTLRALAHFDDEAVQEALKRESQRLELTKSLLNLLHNICSTRVIKLSKTSKSQFAAYTGVVRQILSTESLKTKKRLLLGHPKLVKLVASQCPRESYSSKRKPTSD